MNSAETTSGNSLDVTSMEQMGPGGIKAMSQAYDVLFTSCPRGGFGAFPQPPAQSTRLIKHLKL